VAYILQALANQKQCYEISSTNTAQMTRRRTIITSETPGYIINWKVFKMKIVSVMSNSQE
jgi:hypothetical protein